MYNQLPKFRKRKRFSISSKQKETDCKSVPAKDRNPQQYKNALHNKIDAVEKIIKKSNINGAVNKLENDIKKRLEDWLIDDY